MNTHAGVVLRHRPVHGATEERWPVGGRAQVLVRVTLEVLESDQAECSARGMGRYMALSAFSWQVGFTVCPAPGGYLLAATPSGIWGIVGGLCLVAGFASLAREPRIPREARRSPTRTQVLSGARG